MTTPGACSSWRTRPSPPVASRTRAGSRRRPSRARCRDGSGAFIRARALAGRPGERCRWSAAHGSTRTRSRAWTRAPTPSSRTTWPTARAGPRARAFSSTCARMFPDEAPRAAREPGRCMHLAPLCGAVFRALGMSLRGHAAALPVQHGCAACSRPACGWASRGPHEAQRLHRRARGRSWTRWRSAAGRSGRTTWRSPRRCSTSWPPPTTGSTRGCSSPEGAHARDDRGHDQDDHDTTTGSHPGHFQERERPMRRDYPRARVHGGHRRPGGEREDRAGPGALPRCCAKGSASAW